MGTHLKHIGYQLCKFNNAGSLCLIFEVFDVIKATDGINNQNMLIGESDLRRTILRLDAIIIRGKVIFGAIFSSGCIDTFAP